MPRVPEADKADDEDRHCDRKAENEDHQKEKRQRCKTIEIRDMKLENISAAEQDLLFSGKLKTLRTVSCANEYASTLQT